MVCTFPLLVSCTCHVIIVINISNQLSQINYCLLSHHGIVGVIWRVEIIYHDTLGCFGREFLKNPAKD